MKRAAKPDPYALAREDDSAAKPAASAPAAPKPGMDIEPPIEPKEKRPPIDAGRPAAPGAPSAPPKQGAGVEPSTGAGAEPSTGAAAPSARFTDTMVGGVHVIAFSRGDVIDAEYIKLVGDDIYHHLKDSSEPKVVVDLANVRFLSSSALSMLLALRTVVADKMDGGICLANVADNIAEILRITKLTKLMKIHGDTDKAIRSLLKGR